MPNHEEPDYDHDHHEHHALPPGPHTPSYTSWRNPWVIISCVLIALFLLMGAATIHSAVEKGMIGPRVSWVSSGSRIMGPRGAGRQEVSGATGGGVEVDGVVTAVNGNQLTVAGGGTTTTVQTNSSTQYTGGSSGAVDDTVSASGVISNGTFTATHVAINP